ncbi:hypothetical protein [Priestia megaterium]|uniref:hypothetical protein n=1 Tax=Priestia megaterium TaxID=1404 RepID=UPI003A7FFB82
MLGIIDFWLVKIPEFISIGSELGIIMRGLCFAYITSFIFYFINVHIQNYKAKVKNYRYINNKILKFKELASGLMESIKESAGFKESEDKLLSEREVKEICLKVNPYQKVNLSYGRLSIRFGNYHELFVFVDSETKRLVKDLLLVKEALDSEMMMLLTFIEDCTENHINFSKGMQIKKEDMEDHLGSHATGIHSYDELCSKIVKYIWEESKDYKYYRAEYFEIEAAKNLERLKIESENSNKVQVSQNLN